MTGIRNIMVPTDFSENSDLALAQAAAFAKAFGAAIHLVYVVPEMTGKLREIMSYDPKELYRDLEKRCDPHFKEQIDRAYA